MIDTLYEKFRHWSSNGSVWVISDPHFNDEDSLFMNPNWPSGDDYVKILNQFIGKNDTLICLGDVGDIECVRKLRAGYKVLVQGNHDKNPSYYKRLVEEIYYPGDSCTEKELREKLKNEHKNYNIKIEQEFLCKHGFDPWLGIIDNCLFNEVYSGPLFISDKILLSHEPIYGLQFCTNIHGHCHNGQYDYTDPLGGRHLNVASDVIGWQPLNLGKAIKSGLIAGLPTIHRLVIDKAIENPIHKKEQK